MLKEDHPLRTFVQTTSQKLSFRVEKSQKGCLLGPVTLQGTGLATALTAQRAFCTGEGTYRHLWLEVPETRQREALQRELEQFGQQTLLFSAEDRPATLQSRGQSQRESLRALSQSPHLVVLVPAQWQAIPAPPPGELESSCTTLRTGETLDPEALAAQLTSLQYERVTQVYQPGQFAIRGGIIDLYSLTSSTPVRIELFDIEIESLREFDIDTQISTRSIEHFASQWQPTEQNGSLAQYFEAQDLLLSTDESSAADYLLTDAPVGHDLLLDIQPSPLPSLSPGDFVLQDSAYQLVRSQLTQWLSEGYLLAFASGLEGERERFFELLGEEIKTHPQTSLLKDNVLHTLVLPEARTVLLSISEIFGRYQPTRRPPAQADFWQSAAARHAKTTDLTPGDFVVHAEYGVGKFREITTPQTGEEEHLEIEYRDGAVLEVPIEQAHLVARYVGVGMASPPLSKLGDAKWAKLKKTASESVMDYAARLLRVQAERSAVESHPHPPDTKWMWEFESSFPYQETPDQLTAIAETKQDMESPYAMDRLICGDVGFGKTEIAIRAAFKAVCGGFQVVLLAPTTVLAEQHYRTFSKRMSEFPVRIDLLNRFRKPSEVRATLEGLASGAVDIVIGTHKVLSERVTYHSLGLAIIDEEQRFGVVHKEKFKERFEQIDLLTLSATPIPRTLYLSLMGARDMSVLNTPPANRNPVETSVVSYDKELIQKAIERELARGGQVFFLHNRVETIHSLAKGLQELVPQARIVVGHGQMPREELEEVMHQFVEGEADLLLATTIIESGIDIPNANTILIDRADRFGLADLYQLRGRVGRADRQAYAYLLLPKKELFAGDALKRVSAIRQFTALGSGFKIAMRDLEIRGAGNLLGTKQSGHIAAVGFDLYCQLLQESVAKLKGERPSVRADLTLRVDFLTFAESRYSAKGGTAPSFLPVHYITESKERLAAYRQLSLASAQVELNTIQREWRDRYGPLPLAAKNLLTVAMIKLHGALAGLDSLEVKEKRVMLSKNSGFITLAGSQFPRLKKAKPGAQLTELLALVKDLNASLLTRN